MGASRQIPLTPKKSQPQSLYVPFWLNDKKQLCQKAKTISSTFPPSALLFPYKPQLQSADLHYCQFFTAARAFDIFAKVCYDDDVITPMTIVTKDDSDGRFPHS